MQSLVFKLGLDLKDMKSFCQTQRPLPIVKLLNISIFFWYNVNTRATSTDFSANVIIMRLDDDENWEMRESFQGDANKNVEGRKQNQTLCDSFLA